MSTILDSFPAGAPGGAKPKYPWGEWLDGRVWRLTRGFDFDCTIQSFRVMVHKSARDRGMKVRTVFDGEDAIVVQAYSENGAA